MSTGCLVFVLLSFFKNTETFIFYVFFWLMRASGNKMGSLQLQGDQMTVVLRKTTVSIAVVQQHYMKKKRCTVIAPTVMQ